MCGRFYIDDHTIREIANVAPEINDVFREGKRGDIYPSQSALVITGRTAHLSAEEMKWGFPQYQKKGLVINARAETVLERNMFRESVRRRRCIIPAGQYYEWDAQKNKVTFSGQDQPVLYLAGFFDRFQDGDHFVILTAADHASVSPVQDRGPLILAKEALGS